MAIASVNPATGGIIKEFAALTQTEIDTKLALAAEEFQRFRKSSIHERSRKMHAASEVLLKRKEELARLITEEMGKPITASIAEVEKSAWGCRFYADKADEFMADEIVETEATKSLIRYQPIGPVLAVMPWNYPFWQVFRFAAPALMAGNTGLLKHASNVPQCALAIEEIFLEAGFAPGCFQTLLISASQVAGVVEDPRVMAATLTGSEPAGMSLGSTSGKALKKTVLELGGSDPFVVLPSADLEKTLETAVNARMLNNGQSCIAAKRFILHESIADRFIEGMRDRFTALSVGDPSDPSVKIGPLINKQALDEVEDQVARWKQAGGKVLCGGDRTVLPLQGGPELKQGFFYPPTILSGLSPKTPVAREEFFAPVALVFRAGDAEEALRLANDTDFGLGASAWTEDEEEKEYFANGLEAGCVFINSMVKSDPRIPFGGIKRSGYGRELGRDGMREFVNIKTVWIA